MKPSWCCDMSQVLTVPRGNILEVLDQNSQFSQLVSLVKDIDFDEQLQQYQDVTFFAPTNEVQPT